MNTRVMFSCFWSLVSLRGDPTQGSRRQPNCPSISFRTQQRSMPLSRASSLLLVTSPAHPTDGCLSGSGVLFAAARQFAARAAPPRRSAWPMKTPRRCQKARRRVSQRFQPTIAAAACSLCDADGDHRRVDAGHRLLRLLLNLLDVVGSQGAACTLFPRAPTLFRCRLFFSFTPHLKFSTHLDSSSFVP